MVSLLAWFHSHPRDQRELGLNIARSLLPLPVFLLIRFLRKGHGYFPNMIFPKTFNEKILAKILFDRSPLLITAADKLSARAFIANKIGDKYLPKIYAVWSSPGSIELDPAWGSVAIKANHGAGFVKLIPNSADANILELRELAATWCKLNYGRTYGEWCYRDIKPRVFAEELIGNGDPNELIEYEIFCFSGQPRFIRIIKGVKGTTKKSYYANLQCKDLHISDGEPSPLETETEYQQAPPNFELMLDLAGRISSDFDMVRVDMHNLNGTIYVGELTNYHTGGIIPFRPKGADMELGRNWERSTMKYLPFSDRSRN
jgi:hypothetical protein